MVASARGNCCGSGGACGRLALLPSMNIYELDLPAMQLLLESWNQPRYRATQLWDGLYKQHHGAWSEFTNIPVALREQLSEQYAIRALTPDAEIQSKDGQTRKVAFKLEDGKRIETVLMRYAKRATLCVSTQVGCAMGCVFCATGQMGFKRHLTSGEIVAQVLEFSRRLDAEGSRLTNIVMMGMGEPFHNYEQTMAAVDRLNDPHGFHFGERRITISTVGLVPLIRRFADEHRQVNLAISLHAASDEARSAMLPINRKYPIREVLEACRDYVAKTHRRVSFEWALIQGVNDGLEEARALGGLLRGLLCHVNAIPLNPTQGYAGSATHRERALAFKAELEKTGIPCTVRLRRGIDIAAGCGQLAV
jgi:23S rRNA (adenine2503-C2)-methyltransferase